MIRYHILSESEEKQLKTRTKIFRAEKKKLEDEAAKIKVKVEDKKVTWIEEAIRRTGIYKKDKKYSEPPKQNWSLIKGIYMKLQANKCAYCEQKLEGGEKKIAHDVEHYRPKKNVLVWPDKKKSKKFNFTFPLGDAADGYYLLPYNLFNYTTSCKVCNSQLKRDYFPVKSKRVNNSDTPTTLKREGAYLIYPLGHFDDDDPEDLITFNGIKPIINPNIKDEHKRNRAAVTIAFFELDLRDTLLKQRAEVIERMFDAFNDQYTHPDPERRKQAAKKLARWQLPSSEHSSCARAFFKVCQTDLPTAYTYYKAAIDYIEAHLDT